MTTRRTAPLSAALLIAATLLAGCGGSAGSGAGAAADSGSGSSSAEEASSVVSSGAGASAGASASAASSGTARPDEGGTDAPPFPADAGVDTSEASADAQVTVRDIRTGRQNGFDRVVFEVGGTGTPGWDVRYVPAAASQGSGKALDVAGDAVLQVTITGAGYPFDTGVTEFAGPNPLPGSGTTTVTEVVFDATFEGTTVAFVGTTATAPFRVYALSNPTRVVLDVRDT